MLGGRCTIHTIFWRAQLLERDNTSARTVAFLRNLSAVTTTDTHDSHRQRNALEHLLIGNVHDSNGRDRQHAGIRT